MLYTDYCYLQTKDGDFYGVGDYYTFKNNPGLRVVEGTSFMQSYPSIQDIDKIRDYLSHIKKRSDLSSKDINIDSPLAKDQPTEVQESIEDSIDTAVSSKKRR